MRLKCLMLVGGNECACANYKMNFVPIARMFLN